MSIKRYGVEGGKGTGGQHLPFARAVEADGWLYVSGQTPMVNGELVAGNIIVQSRQAIANLICRFSKKPATARSMLCAAASGLTIRAIFPPSIRSSKNTSAPILRRAPASYPAWSSTAK